MQYIQLNYHLLFFEQLQNGDTQDGGIQIGDTFAVLHPMKNFVPAATFDHYIGRQQRYFYIHH